MHESPSAIPNLSAAFCFGHSVVCRYHILKTLLQCQSLQQKGAISHVQCQEVLAVSLLTGLAQMTSVGCPVLVQHVSRQKLQGVVFRMRSALGLLGSATEPGLHPEPPPEHRYRMMVCLSSLSLRFCP